MKKMNELLILTAVALGSHSALAEGLNLVAQQQQQQYAQQAQPVVQVVQAAPEGQITNKSYNYTDKPLNVSGEVEEEELAPDLELNFINNELGKQKRAHKLNKEKVKGYKKLKKTTEKLVNSTEEYVGERKESESLIKDYNKQIKCLLQENSYDPDCEKEEVAKKVEDTVQVQQAAPMVAPVAPVIITPTVIEDEVVEEKSEFLSKMKIMPALTFVNYTGDNIGNIESNVGLDLRVESDVFSRLAIGLGFNYHTANFTDIPFFGGGFYNQPYYGAGYGNNYGFNNGLGGRGIEMESFGVDLYGKFYLFSNSRMRPYISGTVGFKRVSFEYDNNDPYSFNAYSFGNETFTTNIVDGKAAAGVEVSFGNNVGFFGELAYGMGLTDFGGSDTQILLPDQLRLRDLSDEFTGSGALTLTGGMSFAF